MTRFPVLLLSAAMLLSACTLEGFSPESAPKMASMSQAGTCFAAVYKTEDGKYDLAAGIGDGSAQPSAVYTRGLDAQQVDAAVAKEVAIMKINPECLSTYVHDRAAVDPASTAPATAG